MKKLLAVLSILAFLFVAGPVQASWVNDVVEKDTIYNHIGIECVDGIRIVTLKTEAGFCKEYKVIDDKVIGMRNCGDVDWQNFVKK